MGRKYALERVLWVIITGGCIAACGSANSGSGLDSKISSLEGYSVSGCHALPSVDQIAREIGDYGARAYGCGGLGVVIEPDGQFSDFDAPVPGAPPRLTASDIDARIIDQAKAQFGVTPKRVDCGSSTHVLSGTTLSCHITVPNGKSATFPASVTGGDGHFRVVLH